MTIQISVPVTISVYRDREPWGPSSNWYATLTQNAVVIAITDFAPSRSAAVRAAEKMSAYRGLQVAR